jgi:hypothetical protein
MSERIVPTEPRDAISKLRKMGFEGPFGGGKHQMMERGDQRIPIPNVHGTGKGRTICKQLVLEIMKRAGLTRQEWNRL